MTDSTNNHGSWWVGVSREAWPAALERQREQVWQLSTDRRSLATTSMARHQRPRKYRADETDTGHPGRD